MTMTRSVTAPPLLHHGPVRAQWELDRTELTAALEHSRW